MYMVCLNKYIIIVLKYSHNNKIVIMTMKVFFLFHIPRLMNTSGKDPLYLVIKDRFIVCMEHGSALWWTHSVIAI